VTLKSDRTWQLIQPGCPELAFHHRLSASVRLYGIRRARLIRAVGGLFIDFAGHAYIDTMPGALENLRFISLKEMKMKEERVYRNYHGEFINSRVVKGLLLAEAVYASKLELPRHSHQHGGFCLILQGGYTESYGQTLLECEPSSVKFQPAGEEHSDVYGNQSVRCFIIELQSEWLTRMGAGLLVGNNPLVYKNSSVAWLMMRLRAASQSAEDESPLLIEGLVLELIAETSRNRKRPPTGQPPLWLQQAREFIHEQFSDPLTLSIIAKVVGVHPVYLASSFRRYYRQSIGEYLRHRRVEFACHKIHMSDDSLVEIALAAGFANQSHFTQTFKRMTGLSPAKYRETRNPS
jgi:AraC family transcriptional regulator